MSNEDKVVDSGKRHDSNTGLSNRFYNNYLKVDIGFGDFLKWQWHRHTRGLPKAPANAYQFPMEQADVAWLKANRSATSVLSTGADVGFYLTSWFTILR